MTAEVLSRFCHICKLGLLTPVPDSKLQFKCHLLSVTFSDHPHPCHGISHSVLRGLTALLQAAAHVALTFSFRSPPRSTGLGDRNCRLHLRDAPSVPHYRFVGGTGGRYRDNTSRGERQTRPSPAVLTPAPGFPHDSKPAPSPPSPTSAFQVEPSGFHKLVKSEIIYKKMLDYLINSYFLKNSV